MPKRQLSWDPKRRGAIYCAPACGRNCTYKEFLHAVRKADALVERLGPRFKPHVWENLGWHYAAYSKCERLNVREDAPVYERAGNKSYTAYLSDRAPGGRWVGKGATPQAAIADATRQAFEARAEIDAILAQLPTGRE